MPNKWFEVLQSMFKHPVDSRYPKNSALNLMRFCRKKHLIKFVKFMTAHTS